MGHFGFFQLIKNYAETTLLIGKKYTSQEASYTAQQSSRRFKSPKTRIREKNIYLIVNKCGFFIYKTKNFCLKTIFTQFEKTFADLTPLELCWTVSEAFLIHIPHQFAK